MLRDKFLTTTLGVFLGIVRGEKLVKRNFLHIFAYIATSQSNVAKGFCHY